MKHFFAAALFVLAGLLGNGCATSTVSIDTRGIPKNSVGILHVKLQDGGKSKALAAFREKLADTAGKETLEAIGLNLFRDSTEITLGLLPWKSSGNKNRNINVYVAILRGNFSEENYRVATKDTVRREKNLIFGKYTFCQPGPNAIISLLDKKTLLILGADLPVSDSIAALSSVASAVVASFDGTAPSYVFPEKLGELAGRASNPIVLAASGNKAFPATGFAKSIPASPPDSAYLVLGDDGVTTRLDSFGEFKTPAEVQQFQVLVQTGISAVGMKLGKVSKKSDSPAWVTAVRKILSSVKYENKEKVLTIRAEIESSATLDLVPELAKKL
jgi:hypothetical protein